MILLPYIITVTIISINAGILGPFLIWRRLAFITDTIAHSSILFIALFYMFNINSYIILILTSLILTLVIFKLEHRFPNDLTLSIISSISVACGLIIMSITNQNHNILHQILFGEILTTTYNQILSISILTIITVIIAIFKYKEWVLITISRDIAKVEKVNINISDLLYLSLLILFIVLSIKSIGAILITAFLTIPASSTKKFSDNPKQMIFNTTVFCITSSVLGILFSFKINIPTSPSIIVTMVLLMSICTVSKMIFNKNTDH